jgi:O-antigen/teichoic acid export membrane protein
MTAANGILMLACALAYMDEPTFGRFAAAIGAQLLCSRAILAGLDQGVVRLFTAGRSPDAVVRAAVAITALLGGLAIAAAAGLGARGGLGPFDGPVVLAIGIGAAGTAWFDLGCAALLARLEYRRAGCLMAILPSIRLVATLLAAALSPPAGLLPFLVFPAVTMIGGLVVLAATIARHGLRPDRGTVRRVFGYSWWIGLGDAGAVLSLQGGLFLLVGLGMLAEAGRFGFALQIVQGFFAVFVAFYQALLPKAARLPSAAALPAFLRTAWRTAAILCGGTAISALGAGLVLPMIVGGIRPDLAGFTDGFYALTLFTMVLLLEAPLGVTCQYLLRPRLHVAALWLRCALIAALGLWLVPAHGGLGAGLAQTGGALLAALALLAAVRGRIERPRRNEEHGACAAS